MNPKKKILRKAFRLISFVLLCIVVIASIYISNQNRTVTQRPINNIHKSSTVPLWEQQKIFIEENSDQSLMVSSDQELIFVGSNDPQTPPLVTAYEGETGEKLWTYGKGQSAVPALSLAVSSSTVFVGELGAVTALDIKSGNVVWSTNLPSGKYATKLYIMDAVLYVATLHEYSLLDIVTGTMLNTLDYSSGNLPPWGLEKKAPLFIGNIMYVHRQIGPTFGNVGIAAIDRRSGNRLWILRESVLGNMVATQDNIYALTMTGKLLQISPLTGTSNPLLTFSPSPVKGQDTEHGAYYYSYYLAANVNSHLLFVYLGDSAQLVAYRLK